MKRFFCGAIIVAAASGFVACGDGSSSSVTSSRDENASFFEEGVIWKPVYGDRARTYFNGARTEENFFTLKGRDGKWEPYNDAVSDGGTSKSEAVFTDSLLQLTLSLGYIWKEAENTPYEPVVYPYSGMRVILDVDENTVDLSGWNGVCLVYSSTGDFQIIPSGPDQWFWRMTVPQSEEKSTFQFKLHELKLVDWADGSAPSLQEALKITRSLNFEFGDLNVKDKKKDACFVADKPCEEFSVENIIRIYKIGKYGSCGS